MTGVVSGFGRIVSYAFNGLDMSSAANDVIVVQHRDGSLHSSPFNVRFGKLKVLRPQDKVVSIEVNGAMTKAVMKINSDGEAFWLQPTSIATDSRGESPVNPIASPLLQGNGGLRAASPRELHLDPNAAVSRSRSPQVKQEAISYTSPVTSPKKTTLTSGSEVASAAVSSVVNFNDVTIVDPVHGTVERPSFQHVTVLNGDSDGLAALQVINSAGDAEIADALLPPLVVEAANGAGDAAADPVVNFLEEMNMSNSERKKYDDLLRSFTVEKEALQACDAMGSDLSNAAGHQALNAAMADAASVLTLSKFASHDDVVSTPIAAGASVVTPALTAAPCLGVSPMLPDDPAAAALAVQGCVSDRSASIGSSVAPSNDEGDDASESSETEEDEEDGSDDLEEGMEGKNAAAAVYYKPTATPIAADLLKLNLKPGHNTVRYMTHSSLKGHVVMESSIYLWPSDAKIVVSDIDGTVTKSDVWGHILPMIGRDWTHAGICSLYSKVAKNGYEFVYLTARSMAQQEQTRKFLWSIEQEGATLPRGPVLTAPDRFFTALTQEVSKKAHEFKISCLKGIQAAFPKHSKPFYAGFGNRIGDVVSYTATQIPKHKIFIIDTNSTLHVCRVKQTYKNLAHLVDVTFPPLKPSSLTVMTPVPDARHPTLKVNDKPGSDAGSSSSGTSPSLRPVAATSASAISAIPAVAMAPTVVSSTSHPNSSTMDGGMHEGESVDPDFNSFNFWRIAPEDMLPLVPAVPPKKPSASATSSQHPNGSKPPNSVPHPSIVSTLSAPRSPESDGQAAPANREGSKTSWLPRWLGGGERRDEPQTSGTSAIQQPPQQQPQPSGSPNVAPPAAQVVQQQQANQVGLPSS